jgi:hypothetical protein
MVRQFYHFKLGFADASICTIGSDELNKSPPKPSTMVFMADECKEGHGDQIPADSQLALVQVSDRNYTAMRTHVRWSVHLSALLIT